ncbi:MAG: hypothetical protein ACLR0U_20280 [Enterocloster clostridioformis]
MLRSEVERLGVVVLLSCRVEKIEPAVGGGGVRYKVYTDQGILDAGSGYYSGQPVPRPPRPPVRTEKAWADMSWQEGLGRRIIRPLPALVQLRCQGSMYRQMAGIRTEAGS